MTIKKQFLIELDQKNLNKFKSRDLEIFIKKNIFSGKIIVFKNLVLVKEIIEYVNFLFKRYSNNMKLINFMNIENHIDYTEINNKFIKFQNKIKKSQQIKIKFKHIINYLNFNECETFSDQICLRFNPGKEKKQIGNLNFINAHRDTWASNLFEQINWWFPLFDIEDENSLFFYPNYFNKSIKNNSNIWTFEKYKNNKKKYISTPIITEEINELEKFVVKIDKGDILCFSGHHLHGSNLGELNRMNLESRTISLGDKKNYIIPKNLDGKYNDKKKNWFKNLNNETSLFNYY
jgi:hypothetical protein